MTEQQQHTPEHCPIHDERRRDGDRIVRLETVVERIEVDLSELSHTFRDMNAQQQTMFIESIKSQTLLQSAIQDLTHSMVDQKDTMRGVQSSLTSLIDHTNKMSDYEEVRAKVNDLDKWKWKMIGAISAVVIVVNIIAWLIERVQ